jgi:hypothetical protein
MWLYVFILSYYYVGDYIIAIQIIASKVEHTFS